MKSNLRKSFRLRFLPADLYVGLPIVFQIFMKSINFLPVLGVKITELSVLWTLTSPKVKPALKTHFLTKWTCSNRTWTTHFNNKFPDTHTEYQAVIRKWKTIVYLFNLYICTVWLISMEKVINYSLGGRPWPDAKSKYLGVKTELSKRINTTKNKREKWKSYYEYRESFIKKQRGKKFQKRSNRQSRSNSTKRTFTD